MFEQVKQEIDDKIKTNGNNEITATRLNGVLQDMMDASAEVIEELQSSIGDQVEANPTGEATETLNKVKIGDTNYNIPQTDTSNLATKQELSQGLAGKQDTISDLAAIREDASAGATAMQPVSGATEGNFAAFDANGGVEDSGFNSESFAQSVSVDPNTVTGEPGTSATVTNEGTSANPVFKFTIPKGYNGADAVNPFKGYFGSLSDLQTEFPIGQTGDFANVYDTTVDKTYRYVWDASLSTPAWVQALDSSSQPIEVTPDTATFSTGQSVVDIPIDNTHLDNPVRGALAKAEDVTPLKEELYGASSFVDKQITLAEGRYSISNGVVNADMVSAIGTPPSQCCWLSCSAGDTFKIYGKGSYNVRLYVFADASRNVLESSPTVDGNITDSRSEGLVITAPTGTIFLIINFYQYSSLTDKLQELVSSGDGLVERVESLESSVETSLQQSDVVDNTTTNDATKPLSAKQGMVLAGEINDINIQIDGSTETQDVALTLQQNQYYKPVDGVVQDNLYSHTGTYCGVVSCVAGDKFNVYGKGSDLIHLYIFTDASKNVLLTNLETINTRADGLELTAPLNSTYLFINFLQYLDSDKLQKIVTEKGLEERVSDLEEESHPDIPASVYAGKKLLVFGDSITEFADSSNKRWTDYAEQILGCTIINVAIGGSHINDVWGTELFDPTHSYIQNRSYVLYKASDIMNIYKCTTNHTGPWDDNDFTQLNAGNMGNSVYAPMFIYPMVKAFCDISVVDPDERFKNQIAAAECLYNLKPSDDNRAIIQRLVDIDSSEIDAIIIFEGTNDYGAAENRGTSGSYDTTKALGATNECIKLLNTTFKTIPIFYVTPPVRWYNYSGGTGVANDFSDNYKTNVDDITFKEWVGVLANEYELNHVPVCNLYAQLQWTMWNFSNFFPDNDGTHPMKGFKNIAQKIASFLIANKNF